MIKSKACINFKKLYSVVLFVRRKCHSESGVWGDGGLTNSATTAAPPLQPPGPAAPSRQHTRCHPAVQPVPTRGLLCYGPGRARTGLLIVLLSSIMFKLPAGAVFVAVALLCHHAMVHRISRIVVESCSCDHLPLQLRERSSRQASVIL